MYINQENFHLQPRLTVVINLVAYQHGNAINYMRLFVSVSAREEIKIAIAMF